MTGTSQDSGLGCTATKKNCSSAHSTAASSDGSMVAPLLPNRLLNLAPLPQLQVTSHWLYCPSQLESTALLVVDPWSDMTFKVDCKDVRNLNRHTSSGHQTKVNDHCSSPHPLVDDSQTVLGRNMSWTPFVPSCTRTLQPDNCNKEGSARL